MKTLAIIQKQLADGEFEFSRHAFKRAIERNISDLEIREAGKNAIIIEDYPNDKYSPSCLMVGFTSKNRPLHLQVSLADLDLVKIITIYEPDEAQWINYTIRRNEEWHYVKSAVLPSSQKSCSMKYFRFRESLSW